MSRDGAGGPMEEVKKLRGANERYRRELTNLSYDMVALNSRVQRLLARLEKIPEAAKVVEAYRIDERHDRKTSVLR